MSADAGTLVSVVVPVHNCRPYLATCLDSALAQTHAALEVIAVDDGSTDGSAEVLAAYAGRIRVVSQRNAGASAARNHGAALARGSFLAFLDSDDTWDPEKTARQVALLQQHPRAVATYCDHRTVDAGGRLTGYSEALDAPRSSGRIVEDLIRGVRIKSPTLVMLRRQAFEAVGGFDQTLRYAEDHDLFIRLALQGPVLYQIDTLASYRVHDASLSFAPGAELKASEGLMRVLEKLVFESDAVPRKVRAAAMDELFHAAVGVGWARRQAGLRGPAAQAYRRALSLRPAALRVWAAYLRALLGPGHGAPGR